MNDHRTDEDSGQSSKMSRRRFLLASGAASAGLMFLPRYSAASEFRLLIVTPVARLAGAFGSQTLDNNIITYVKRSYVPSATEQEVYRVNRMMAQDSLGHFDDLSASAVYAPRANYFFYNVKSRNGLDSCVAFFDTNRAVGEQNVALIEGPTLLGIAYAAEEVAQLTSTAVASGIFLPLSVISRGAGGWRTSYAQPDTYVSKDAAVGANYTIYSDGHAEVAVRAVGQYGPLFQKNYPVAAA